MSSEKRHRWDVSMISTNQADKLDRSIVDLLPVEILEHILTYLSLDDRKNMRLTCKVLNDLCNSRKFLDKEKFAFRRNKMKKRARNSPFAVLSGTWRPILRLHFIDVSVKTMTENLWEKIGDRIRCLLIGGYYGLDNAMLRNILFHCTHLDTFLCIKTIVTVHYTGWMRRLRQKLFTDYKYRLESVSDVSSGDLTIRPLNQCCCSLLSAKEIYASTYDTNGRIQMETIYPDTDPQKIRYYRFLLKRIMLLKKPIFKHTNRVTYLYVGMRIKSVDFHALKTLKRVVRTQPNLQALVLRFDSSEENSDSTTEPPLKKIKSSSLEQHNLKHLTIYGGCRGTLRIFENFALPSLKHLDVYASDVPLVTEQDERSSIMLVLDHIARRLPNLQMLRVDNVSEWVEVRTSSVNISTSNFQISGKDEDVCGGDECCKLSSVQHRFKERNYRLTENCGGLFIV